MSQENVELATAFFDAYNARDSEAVDGLLDPDAEITTLTERAGLPTRWSPGTTRQYFEQLDEAFADLRVEIEAYRELGERVVALGVIRGAGKASHVEVADDLAVVFVIRNSRFVHVETYNSWRAALEAAGLSESAMSDENEEVVRQVVGAFNRRDLAAMTQWSLPRWNGSPADLPPLNDLYTEAATRSLARLLRLGRPGRCSTWRRARFAPWVTRLCGWEAPD